MNGPHLTGPLRAAAILVLFASCASSGDTIDLEVWVERERQVAQSVFARDMLAQLWGFSWIGGPPPHPQNYTLCECGIFHWYDKCPLCSFVERLGETYGIYP